MLAGVGVERLVHHSTMPKVSVRTRAPAVRALPLVGALPRARAETLSAAAGVLTRGFVGWVVNAGARGQAQGQRRRGRRWRCGSTLPDLAPAAPRHATAAAAAAAVPRQSSATSAQHRPSRRSARLPRGGPRRLGGRACGLPPAVHPCPVRVLAAALTARTPRSARTPTHAWLCVRGCINHA